MFDPAAALALQRASAPDALRSAQTGWYGRLVLARRELRGQGAHSALTMALTSFADRSEQPPSAGDAVRPGGCWIRLNSTAGATRK